MGINNPLEFKLTRNHYVHAHIITVSEVKIVNCTEGEARLVNGPSANKGRVEICIDQSWATVCITGFGHEESRVICGQLGYQRYGIQRLPP